MTTFDTYFKNLALDSILVPNSITSDPNLNGNAKLVYAELLFRMRLSVKQGRRFFNRRFQQFYIIFPVRELSHKLGLGKNTTSRSLKKLEKKGLIFRLRLYHRTLIFMPKLFKKIKQNKGTKTKTRHQNGSYGKTTKMGIITRRKTNRIKNNMCVLTTKNRKLVKAFRKNWKPSNDDITRLSQLSNDFSTKLILKAIKITKYKEFKTTAINFITGVIRRIIIEARQHKQSKQSSRLSRPRTWHARKHSLKDLNHYYDPKLVAYAEKLAKMSHKIIYNRFNFVAGILFRWRRIGINSLIAAKNYERDSNRQSCNSSQIRQRNLVLEKLPAWENKGYKYNSKKDKANPKIKAKAKKILYRLRGNRTPKQWQQYKSEQRRNDSPLDLA